MSNDANAALHPAQEKPGAGNSPLESIGHFLNESRTRIDELLVQRELAKLDIRDEVDHQVAIAENASSVARSELSEARLDVCSAVEARQRGLDLLLHDLGRAYAEVDAPVTRTREQPQDGFA